jgi:hypothetical protein
MSPVDLLPVLDHEDRVDRKRLLVVRPVRVLDDELRVLLLVLRLDDHLAGVAGQLVDSPSCIVTPSTMS